MRLEMAVLSSVDFPFSLHRARLESPLECRQAPLAARGGEEIIRLFFRGQAHQARRNEGFFLVVM
jgi:hypothetical protein